MPFWGKDAEACLYVCVAAVGAIQAYLTAAQAPRTPGSLPLRGARTRSYFLALFGAANLLRAAALSIGFGELTRTAVSLPFCSTYSLVAGFWAQVYYASSLIHYPELPFHVMALNCVSYACAAGALAAGYASSDWLMCVRALHAELGVLYLALATAFYYYGTNVGALGAEMPVDEVVRRVRLLALVCPVFFCVRAVVEIGSAYGVKDNATVD